MSTSYGHQLDQIGSTIRSEWKWPSPSSGFASYLAAKSGARLPVGCEILPLSADRRARMDEAPLLAAVGYAMAINRLDDTETILSWKEGIERLRARKTFTADRESFVYRPFDLLGIALGLKYCMEAGEASQAWLVEILRTAETDLREGGVVSAILAAWAANTVGVTYRKIHLPAITDLSPVELALAYWVVKIDPALLTDEHPPLEMLQTEIMQSFAVTHFTEPDVARGFLLYSSLRQCVEDTPKMPVFVSEPTSVPAKLEVAMPSDLIKSLQNGTATVIAGAGISRAAADLSGWDQALQNAVAFLRKRGVSVQSLDTIEPLMADGFYEEAAQIVERLLKNMNGKADFLRRQFHVEPSQLKDRALVEAVWRLARTVVFTTNYDRVFEHCGPSGIRQRLLHFTAIRHLSRIFVPRYSCFSIILVR